MAPLTPFSRAALLGAFVASGAACVRGNAEPASAFRYGAPPPQAQAYGNPQGPPAPAPWRPGAPPPPMPPPIYRPVDIGRMMALQGRHPCAPTEMAPGVWVQLDCAPFREITRATQLLQSALRPFTGLLPGSGGAVGGGTGAGLPGLAGFPGLAGLPGLGGGNDANGPSRAGTVGALTGPLPEGVDHRAAGTEGPIKDQGAVGACTAFSLSSAMDNAIRRMGRQDVVAPLHVWSQYAVPSMGPAGDDNVDKNLSIEQTWPYDPAKACRLSRSPGDECSAAYGVVAGSGAVDPGLRAEQASADAQGRYRLAGIEKLSTPPDLDQIAAVLAGGDDIWASFTVDPRAWKQATPQSSTIPDYPGGQEGHAVVLAGYRTVNGQRQFLIHNSWSPRWGEQGYGWLSAAMVSAQFRAAYKVRVVDATAPVNPLPGPGPASGCPAGQVPDSVLHSCVNVCASGSAPAAGMCLPSLPGFPPAPNQPLPGAPQGGCPAGQAVDLMKGACAPACPGGAPALGGMCLPVPGGGH